MPASTWRNPFGSLPGSPTPTQQQQARLAPPPIASSFGISPTNNGPPPSPPRQQPQGPSQGNPGEVAGFLGTPVEMASYLLRKAGMSVPENVPLGAESWQRMLDTYNASPVTLGDLAARRVR